METRVSLSLREPVCSAAAGFVVFVDMLFFCLQAGWLFSGNVHEYKKYFQLLHDIAVFILGYQRDGA